MKLEFYPETRCDDCTNIVHNHFDCPACKTEYAGTNVYEDFAHGVARNDAIETFEFECEVCNTGFRIVSAPDDFNEWEWESLPNSESRS